MNDLTPSPLTAETTCLRCAQSYPYTPILVSGRDLALTVERHCPACAAELEHEAEEETRAMMTAERIELFKRTVPPSLWPKHLDPDGTDTESPDFNGPLWNAASRWRPRKKGDRIALIGPAGQCKTRCLALLAESLILRGNHLMWTSAMRLHDEATFHLRSRDRGIQAKALSYLNECRTAPWLFLDDIGNNEWSPAFESQLFTILDYRMTNFLPMAFSSNKHPDALRPLITKVDPTAFIGRLINRASIFDCTPDSQIPLPVA